MQRSETAFGRKRTFHLYPGCRTLHRPTKPLENSLYDMVPVFTMQQIDMQSKSTVLAHCPEKLLGQSRVKASQLLFNHGSIVMQKGPIGNIDDNPNQGFIHRHRAIAVAGNTAFIGQSSRYCLPKTDADILHRMMIINFRIACCLNNKIKKTVHTEKGKHMV